MAAREAITLLLRESGKIKQRRRRATAKAFMDQGGVEIVRQFRADYASYGEWWFDYNQLLSSSRKLVMLCDYNGLRYIATYSHETSQWIFQTIRSENASIIKTTPLEV